MFPNYTDNHNVHFKFNNFLFENCGIYETMWKNIVQPDRPQMTLCHMPTSRWITKARNTHSEYETFIAFPLQQLLLERA